MAGGVEALPAFSCANRADARGVRIPAFDPIALTIGVTLGAALVAGIAVVTAAGLRIEVAGFARFAALATGLFALAGWCRLRRIDRRLAAAASIVGSATLSLLLCGVISNAGLALAFPLADAHLAAIDATVGFDAGAIIRAVASHTLLVDSLSLAYNVSGVAVVLVILASVARGQLAKAWELAVTAIVAMQIVALASLPFPAWGAMKHFALQSLQGDGLPVGAGIYQWPAFTHFRTGGDALLRLADMGGVVAIPSFHTVLALMMTQALGHTKLRWLAIVFTATVIVAAIPMGGHYIVDLAAGFAVWAASATLARRVSNPSA